MENEKDAKPINKSKQATKMPSLEPKAVAEVVAVVEKARVLGKKIEAIVSDEAEEWVEEAWAGSKFETAHNVVDGFVDRIRGLDNAEEIFTRWFDDATHSKYEDLRELAAEHLAYLKSRENR